MNLQVSAVYQPEADEVLVDVRSTQDDLITATVPDELNATLYVGNQDLQGAWNYSRLSNILVSGDYVQAEKNFLFKFRHPRRRVDLFLDVDARYGNDSFSRSKVKVGIGADSQQEMALPDNAIYIYDPLDNVSDGEIFQEPNKNHVILASPLREYASAYDFTVSKDTQEFEPLVYTGGGNRLLMNNQNNSFALQPPNQAPWVQSAYVFMEGPSTNLIPNSFFNVSAQSHPTGFSVDSAGALLTQSVAPDYATASGAQLWTLRLRQSNMMSAFNQAVISLSQPLAISGGSTYCFSVYARIKNMAKYNWTNKFILALIWSDGSQDLPESVIEVPTEGLAALGLASLSAQAPLGAVSVRPEIRLGSIDFGEDIQLVLFAPQFELGSFPSSRTEGTRLSDQITIPTYNAANQKIRLEFIPGFGVGTGVSLTQGPLELSITPTGALRGVIAGSTSLETPPLSFSVGDILDFTVQHQSGGKFKIFQNGTVLAETDLPVFPETSQPLNLLGFGGELLRLTVFSRK